MSNLPKQPESISTILSPEAAEAKQLIAIYNQPFVKEKILREQAVRSLIQLVNANANLLAMVIDDAKEYARMAHVCDFSPWDPNAFAVLLQVGWKAEVIAFLSDLVRREYGIPRWDALETLCRMEHPEADRVVEEVSLGHYPPTYHHEMDQRVVECARASTRASRVVAA